MAGQQAHFAHAFAWADLAKYSALACALSQGLKSARHHDVDAVTRVALAKEAVSTEDLYPFAKPQQVIDDRGVRSAKKCLQAALQPLPSQERYRVVLPFG